MQPSILRWFLCVISGTLAFLGYAGFDQFYLQWIFLVPLLWALQGQTLRRSFFLGWLAGTVGHAGGFYWFVHLLSVFAGLNLIFSILGLILLAAYNGLTFALFAAVLRHLQSTRGWQTWWIAPLVWTALENLFPFIFPNYIGAGQYQLLPLIQIADITGLPGISFLLIAGNALIFTVCRWAAGRRPFPAKAIWITGFLIAAAILYGFIRIHQVDRQIAAASHKKVVLFQAGLGEAEKHRDRWSFFRQHISMLNDPDTRKMVREADLVIWPESVITVPISRNRKPLPWELFGKVTAPLLFGSLTGENTFLGVRRYTSAILINDGNMVKGIYDKQILVPFGEYIPFGERFPFLYNLSPYISRFTPGSDPRPLELNGYRLSVNICYEDLFADLVRRNMLAGRSPGAPLPRLIVNLTNDSWYGDTTEPKEHLVLAAFRAIEHRRTLVRATNTGISALVDPAGRISKQTGQWTREVLAGAVPLLGGRTLYSHVGNLFGRLVTFIAALLLLVSAFRTQRTPLPTGNKRRKR